MSRRGERSVFHRRQRRPLVALYRCGLHALEGALRADRRDASREANGWLKGRASSSGPISCPDRPLERSTDRQVPRLSETRKLEEAESERLQIINAKASFLSEHEIVSEGDVTSSMLRLSRAVRRRPSENPRTRSLMVMAFGRVTKFCITPGFQNHSPSSAPVRSAPSFRCVTSGSAPRSRWSLAVACSPITEPIRQSDSRRFISRKVFVF